MKTKKETFRKIIVFFTTLYSFIYCTVFADEVKIKITGEIYAPPCKINNDLPFDISFGNISLREIDGNNFKQTKTVSVECTNTSGNPYISIVSNTGIIGENILDTNGANKTSLGIALYQGDSIDNNYPLKINTDKDMIRKGLSPTGASVSSFTFTAVPYRNGGTTLIAGTFNATITMNIFYM